IALVYLLSEGVPLALFPVVVEEAPPGAKIYDHYFPLVSDTGQIRNIAVIRGPFSKETALSAYLFHVNAGVIEMGNSFAVGRSRNRIGEPAWLRMNIRLVLGEQETSDGRVTMLGSAGHTWSSSCMCPVVRHVREPVVTKALPGRLAARRQSIVYVEGDREF